MNPAEPDIRETAEGIAVRLHVQPRARHSEIVGIHNGALKLKVTAPPVDDAANRAIIEHFSSLLGISKSSLQITSGLKSRDKTLQIKGISAQTFLARIDL
jgi:uncharacterized protein (TIGR00251 family)